MYILRKPKPPLQKIGGVSVRLWTARDIEKAQRERARAKAKKLNKPPHGRAPGTLKSLAESRAKQARTTPRSG